LYNLFKDLSQPNINIKLRIQFDKVGIRNFKHILEMEGTDYIRGYINFYNYKWTIRNDRYRTFISKDPSENRFSKEAITFTSDNPEKNHEILDEFIEYFRFKCKENGINIT
ncbi:MAG: hypothetical protein ACFFAO_00330, partial [Candidatus Hermodarchaeota archaeon]